ncbi:MAG: hypothetical protein K0S47_2385 [Herbinix sp.]|jgi:spore germination cell wall hydrolase CwlJ-like protein|nr:hypothetical protein [Herbinix sp.]
MKSKKLLVTLFLAVIFSICLGSTAFASEVNTNEMLPTQDTEATDSNIVTSDIQSENQDDLDESQPVTVNEEEIGTGTYNNEQEDEDVVANLNLSADTDVVVESAEEVIEEVVEEDVTEEKVTKEIKEAEDDKEVKTEAKEKKEDKKSNKKEETKPVAKKPSYSEKDLRLLSCLIFAEAGNQSYNGMLAVANVVLNRAKSDVYWHVNTISEVIYDRKWSVQFAVTIENSKGVSTLDRVLKKYDSGKYASATEKANMEKCIKAAKAALEGENNIGNYLCFNRVSNSIKNRYSSYKIIGSHIFYRTK